MLLLLIFVFLVIVVFVSAARIVLGWILPREAMAQFDRFVVSALKLTFQLSIVGLAGMIGYAFWQSS